MLSSPCGGEKRLAAMLEGRNDQDAAQEEIWKECGKYSGTRGLSDYCERFHDILPEEQYGFRPQGSTVHMMSVGRRLHELAKKEGTPLFMCSIHVINPYGSVDRSLSWATLSRFV